MTSLNPTMTIGDQIAETLIVHRGFSKKQAHDRAIELLTATRIPDAAKRARQYPFEFSGGMLQRSMIAMAIACEPKILIADEPTTALDVTIQAQILDLLKDLQRETGMAIILITHDLGVVARMADRVNVMYAGEIVEHGTDRRYLLPFRAPVHARPARCDAVQHDRSSAPAATDRRQPAGSVRAAGRLRLLRALPARDADLPEAIARRCSASTPATRRAAGCTIEDAHRSVDRLHVMPRVSARALMTALISADKLTQTFHDRRQRRSCTRSMRFHCDIAEKEIVGLVGESGSGKSTLGKAMVGLHDKTSGTVTYRGERLPQKYTPLDFQRHAQRMQMIFQDPYSSLNPRMTVGEIIGEGLTLNSEQRAASRSAIALREWLARVGLEPDHMSRYPHEFSGGQRQRIGIARALILEPEFIVCDEPISALDVSVQAQVVNLLDDLKASLGLTLLFIAHDLSMVRYVSDRMAVMYLGSLVEIGPADRRLLRAAAPLYTTVGRIESRTRSRRRTDPDKHADHRRNPVAGEHSAGLPIRRTLSKVMDVCRVERPELKPLKTSSDEVRLVACHLFD